MNLDRAVFAFAGIMIMLSMALGYFVNPLWYLLNVFVGANILQAAFTGFCPAAMVFKAMGAQSGSIFK